jgi:hypothetical protein
MAGLSQAGTRFGGVWEASFKGTVICTIEIEDKGDTVEGVSKSCKVSVDQNGDLLETEAPDGSEPPQPFVKPKVDGSSIRYELEENDGSRMKFEFRLTGEGKAELRFVDAPIAIKPIRFERRT